LARQQHAKLWEDRASVSLQRCRQPRSR
jgi:hypothetical protein